MKHFIDGDQVVITKDDFENLQESPAVFMPKDSDAGRRVLQGGPGQLRIGQLRRVVVLLNDGGGVLDGDI